MTAAGKFAKISEGVKATLPEGVGELFDEIAVNTHHAASKGLRGISLTLEIPQHLWEFCPHIVGDLRSGGFQVDVVECEASASSTGIILTLFITW